MLIAVVLLKGLIEVAGLALLGQGILYVLAGARREENLFYRILRLIASPAVKLTRLITPRRLVPDAYIGVAAFFLLAGLWLGLGIEKIAQCREQPGHALCEGVVPRPATVPDAAAPVKP